MKIFGKISAAAIVIVFIFGLFGPAKALTTTVELGTADDFAVLAGSAITNIPTSDITGNVGLSPTTGAAITGLTCAEVTGTIYDVDGTFPGACEVENPGLLSTAKNDLADAYDDAAGRTPDSIVPTELGGTTKTTGIYKSAAGTFGITGTVTLDAEDDPNAVFIFQTDSTLITAASSSVNLINGAQACNVFWQIGSSVTLGASSTLKGNILALTSATLGAGANVTGRVLARNGAVTMSSNVITKATCQGTINVVKNVINDSGGTKAVSDFPLFVDGSPVTSGETNNFPAPGSYTVSEITDAGYVRTFSGACDSNGNVTLNPGENLFCIVTNDDIGVPESPPPVPPLIDLVKVPDPLALPDGPGSVTYTYTLNNIGTVPVTDITMVGDTCSPITLDSGDTNSNAELDVSETWTYSCSTTLTETHTNIVTATGSANGITANDIASATVVVGVPEVVPPLIHVTKVPSPLTLLAGGGTVTYTETLTNPGTVPLSNVTLTDDRCSPLTFISGDTNSDTLLDDTETWTYTCQANLTETTTNVATATGDANGLTATDIAIVNVVVVQAEDSPLPEDSSDSPDIDVPKLPNAGFSPKTYLLSDQ
jgi:uncharacterized repeat protein (TIGR01451 family)